MPNRSNTRITRKPQKKSRRLLYGLITAASLLVVIGGVLAYHQANKTTKPVATSAAQTAKSTPNYSTKPLNSTQVNADNTARKDSSDSSPTLNSPTTNPDLSVTITRVSNSAVYTEIEGATSGSCSLDAKLTGRADVTANSSIIQNVNSYQCDDFKLANNQFSSGHWSIVVSVTSNGATASSEAWQL